MVKKISTLALAALLALPVTVSAAASPADLEAQIERMSKELSALKQQMADLQESSSEAADSLSEKSEKWDEAARIQLSGDFRTRLDYVSADTPEHFTSMDVARGSLTFANVFSNFVTDVSPVFDNNGNFVSNSPVGITPAEAGAFQNATIGDLFQAQQTGAPVGTATPDALAAMGKLSNQQLLSPMLAVLPSLYAQDPNQTMGQIANSFGGIFGAGATAVDPHQVADFMKSLSRADRLAAFNALNAAYAIPASTPSKDYNNDTMWTNRLRVNLRAKATEDVEFKARLAMYKAWGMENNPVDYTANAGMGGGPFMLNSLSFDGNSTRQPSDNALRVDRAFMNWNNIGGTPTWFSIGRRPTTDGPPEQFRMGADERMATPVAYMDYPFDGLSVGYAYKSLFGVEDFPGRVRFCYGRGFEAGPTDSDNSLKDTEFAGVSWDVYNKGDRFFNIQSFKAANMFNVPDNASFPNPFEFQKWLVDPNFYNPTLSTNNLILDRANLGDIYHTDAVYYNKVQNLNYFLTAGWSRTHATGMDELGTSLLGSWWDDPSDKDGYSFYTGVRYDIPDSPFKVGLEYNYGTKNWISFTPGNDDLYASKLATRGHVIEAYGIWNIPAGEAISKFGKAFMRLGYQHYQYNYTGSGFWLGEPLDIDDLANDPLAAQFYTPVESMDQVYATIEAWF